MSVRRAALLAAGTLLVGTLGGCAFAPQLQRVAVDHNRMVADSADELALLNIVRASHRFPLHFTAITEVAGNVEASTGANLSIDLDPKVDPATADIAGSITTKPSFRAAVLASDDFQRGIQAPIKPELIAYYLDEGWRDELLMALTVERVEAYANPNDAQPKFSIINTPERGSDFAQLLCTHAMVSQPTASSFPLAHFEQLVDFAALRSRDTDPATRRREIGSLLDLLARDDVRLTGDTLVIDGSTNTIQFEPRSDGRCGEVKPDPRLAGLTLRPRFRSTLGLIYFLGEYLRLAEEYGPDAVYRIPNCESSCGPGKVVWRPLITVNKGTGRALIATQFMGERYYVSAAEDRSSFSDDQTGMARSMQVIALVEQLLNLQKSAKSLPTSLTITGIN